MLSLAYYDLLLMIIQLSKLVPSISYISYDKSKETLSKFKFVIYCLKYEKSKIEISSIVMKGGNKNDVFLISSHFKSLKIISK